MGIINDIKGKARAKKAYAALKTQFGVDVEKTGLDGFFNESKDIAAEYRVSKDVDYYDVDALFVINRLKNDTLVAKEFYKFDNHSRWILKGKMSRAQSIEFCLKYSPLFIDILRDNYEGIVTPEFEEVSSRWIDWIFFTDVAAKTWGFKPNTFEQLEFISRYMKAKNNE